MRHRLSFSMMGILFLLGNYVLVYRINRETIQVIAVAHLKRNPGYWQGRNNS